MAANKKLIVIGGPTASGKTDLAIRLARHFNTEIISADSRQFFREMTIGTAKPSPEELASAPHHLIGHLSIEQEYHVGAFEKEALNILKTLFAEKEVVIVVGGSGLYLKALCEGLDRFPEVPANIRQEVETFFQKEGLIALQEALAKADPDYFAEVDQHNPHRLIRALAVYRASGRPFSSFRKKDLTQRSFDPIYLQMQWPRQELYDRINRRVDLMVQAGLQEEATRLFPYRNHTALQTVGYQEIFDFLEQKHDWDTAVELIKRNSRRYAKRQLTWMRRDGFWKHFHPSEWEFILEYLQSAIHKNWIWQEDTIVHPDLRNKEGKEIRLQSDSRLLAKAVQFKEKKFTFFQGPFFPDPMPNPEIHRFLIHELVARAEESDCYVQCKAREVSLFESFGFRTVAGERVPALEKYLHTGLNQDLRMLLRPPVVLNLIY